MDVPKPFVPRRAAESQQRLSLELRARCHQTEDDRALSRTQNGPVSVASTTSGGAIGWTLSPRKRGDLRDTTMREEDGGVTTETTSVAQAAVFWSDLTPRERQGRGSHGSGVDEPGDRQSVGVDPKTVENRASVIYEKLPATPMFTAAFRLCC